LAQALENTHDTALVCVGQRTAMPVGLLHAGSDAAEVQRVLGRPTTTTPLDALGANRLLIYVDEADRTEVMLTAGHVTAIALDLLPIDSTQCFFRHRFAALARPIVSSSVSARIYFFIVMIPRVRRIIGLTIRARVGREAGVLALLGKPDEDQKEAASANWLVKDQQGKWNAAFGWRVITFSVIDFAHEHRASEGDRLLVILHMGSGW
jgi:hypothetical protein